MPNNYMTIIWLVIFEVKNYFEWLNMCIITKIYTFISMKSEDEENNKSKKEFSNFSHN